MNAIQIKDKDAKKFVAEFLEEYLSDGIGAKSKREIDILVMNLLVNYGGLAGKSNQDLSILLQAPESKIKGLLYEARLKYPPDADYVKREFLYVLTASQFDHESGKIVFAMEDNYLRHAIQGRLKAKGMFADSSFNSELVKISRSSLEAVIGELYGKETAAEFREGFDAMESQLEGGDVDAASAFTTTIIEFAVETAKKFAFELIKSRIGF
jgi:hypothetical protein